MMSAAWLGLAFTAGLFVAGFPLFWLWFRARRAALRDRLTDLPNYAGFLRAFQVRWRKLPKRPLGVVLTDLDDFQRYNQRGYAYGDRVLKSFADGLSGRLSGLAFCARYRFGDEFIVLFDAENEAEVVQRLQSLRVLDPEGQVIGFSYGIQLFQDPPLSPDVLLEEVQLRLFSQKRMKESLA